MDKKGSEKKDRLLSALEQGMVMIHLDARRPGVLVPPPLKQEAHLRLNLSYRFDPPDLTVGDWGIRSTLSFSGSRFRVAVPWSALFAITSYATKEFWMYPDDMPKELIQHAALSKARRTQAGHNGVHPAVGAVQTASHSPSDEREPDPPDKPRPATHPHLRVIK